MITDGEKVAATLGLLATLLALLGFCALVIVDSVRTTRRIKRRAK